MKVKAPIPVILGKPDINGLKDHQCSFGKALLMKVLDGPIPVYSNSEDKDPIGYITKVSINSEYEIEVEADIFDEEICKNIKGFNSCSFGNVDDNNVVTYERVEFFTPITEDWETYEKFMKDNKCD